MAKIFDASEQLIIERRKNKALQALINKQASDIDYLAMMADVELMQEDEEGMENEPEV